MHATPIRPGRYVRGDSLAPFDVTWWDPAQLHLGAEPSLGSRQKALIDKKHRRVACVRATRPWTTGPSCTRAALLQGVSPSVRVQRVTEAARGVDLAGNDVAVLQVPSAAPRRGGRAFGALVHEVLAVIGLDATHADVATATEYSARVLGDSDVDQSSVITAVCDTLQHPC